MPVINPGSGVLLDAFMNLHSWMKASIIPRKGLMYAPPLMILFHLRMQEWTGAEGVTRSSMSPPPPPNQAMATALK